MKKIQGKGAFTLIEIMVVIILVGVLASLSYPRLTVVVERVRSGEGANILATLLAAQKRYALENNGAYMDGTAGGGTFELGPTDLDVAIPASNNFSNYYIYSTPAEVAKVQRATGEYTMSIDEDGDISCSDSGTGICFKLGY